MTSFRRIMLFPLALTCLAAAGCGSSAQQRLEGTWVGTPEIDEAKVRQSVTQKVGAAIAKEVMSKRIETLQNSRMTIEFRPDGTAKVEVKTGTVTETTEGKCELTDTGNVVGLKIHNDASGGSPYANVLEFTDDGRFTIDGGAAKELGITRFVFERQGS